MSEVVLDFQKIHDEFRPKIQRYLMRLVGEYEAEDLTQDVFLKISRVLQTFKGESKLSTWIYRIATNLAIDEMRFRLLGTERTPEVALELALRLKEAIRERVGEYLTCSIGIACCPQDGADPETLMKNADLAMYRAKSVGRNNYQFFSPDLEQGALLRLTLESSMRRGLERAPVPSA